MKRCDVAISGFGRIGRSVAALLEARRERYRERYDTDVRVTAVCTSRGGRIVADGLPGLSGQALPGRGWPERGGSDRGVPEPQAPLFAGPDGFDPALTGDAFVAAACPHVLIEAGPSDPATGGAAYAYLRAALAAGAHGIAISKGALVFDYPGLRALADASGVALKISGATSAALPTIDLLDYNLAGCEVRVMEGIFTATTNFVLARAMAGVALADAVAEAQRAGMAEPDPRFDLEGWDTAAKVCILANAGFGARLTLDAVAREGIDGVSPAMLDGWRAAGVVPKLVGRIERNGARVQASVRLRAYAPEHPFAGIGAGMKAVRVETDAMGELFAIGRTSPGATAAAALKDLEHLLMRGAFRRR